MSTEKMSPRQAAQHITKFITEVAVHFKLPKYENARDEAAWLESMHRTLAGASPQVLDFAAKIIVDTRDKSRSFPLPAECREAVRQAAEEAAFEARKQQLNLGPQSSKPKLFDRSQERQAWIVTLLKCELGRRAVKEHWHLALYDFAERMGRLPDQRRYEARYNWERIEHAGCTEIEFCKRSAAGFDETFTAVIRGKGGPWSEHWGKLGDSIAKARNELAQEIMG